MMKRLIVIYCAAGLLAIPAMSASLFKVDFMSAEGFSDGVPIDGIYGFNAQASWTASNTDGDGYATYDGGWQRARNQTDFSLEIGDTVVIETVFRLTATSWPNSDAYYFGFADESQHAGADTPSIGSRIHCNTDGSLWIGSGDSALQRVDIPAADAGDWIWFSQTITRSATTGEFTGTVSVSNLTKNVDLGSSASAWTQSTADGSWGGVMNASFRGLGASVTIEIDQWVAYTVDTPVEPPEGPEGLPAVVNVDVTRKRSIGGIQTMDRETWFGVYHEVGYGTRTLDGKSIDEWIYDEGRMWPSRGTVGYKSYWDGGSVDFTEDPTRSGYINPAETEAYLGPVSRYVTAQALDPNHKTIYSGSGHGEYPDFMCWPTNLTSGINTVSNHAAHGEAVVTALANIDHAGGLMPTWYEVMNESSIQNNFGWFWDSDAWDKLSEFHLEVANAVHASAYSNSVKVAGPIDAYPFRDDKDGDFSPWEGGNKKFIHQTENKLGAHGVHTYEQMNGGTSFEDYQERFEVWHLGRLPAFLDLWQSEQFNTWGETKPFVISEYGMLNNIAGDTNAFYQIRSCNGILLSLMDRPDVMDKMSAFLMSWAPYNWDQKRVFFASEDNGATIYKTSYFEYLRFWHDLDGDYLFSSADTPHLVNRSFLDETTLYVVMQNNYNTNFTVDVQTALPMGASVVSAQAQRVYLADNDVARDVFAPVDPSNVYVGADETVMVKVELGGLPLLDVWEETNHYGDQTLVPMVAGAGEDFLVNLPAESGKSHTTGRVTLGLYAFEGFSSGLREVRVNGTALTNLPDLSYSAGAPRYWANVELEVPAGVLTDGVNMITVVPDEGDSLMKTTSVRLTTVKGADAVLAGDRDGDGMADGWEIEHNLDPADYKDGTPDNDGDGFSNAQEYVCNTDPNDENDFLTAEFGAEVDGFRVRFDSRTGRYYSVDISEDLKQSWRIWTNGIPGTGSWIDLMDEGYISNRFYKVKVGLE